MNVELRLERPEDYYEVELLTREAFWGMHHPDCDEHCLVHKLRESEGFVPELDFVAEAEGKIIGHIIYSKAYIRNDAEEGFEVLNFGPLTVRPELQNKGIGKLLMNHTIGLARELGYRAIVFFGHPDYYPKVGFRRAAEFGITDGGGTARDALMAMPLYEGALDGVKGRYHEDAAFDISEEEKEAYNRKFPPKELHKMLSVELLADVLPETAMGIIREKKLEYLCIFTMYSQKEVEAWAGITKEDVEIIKRFIRSHGIRWGE